MRAERIGRGYASGSHLAGLAAASPLAPGPPAGWFCFSKRHPPPIHTPPVGPPGCLTADPEGSDAGQGGLKSDQDTLPGRRVNPILGASIKRNAPS